MDIQKTLSPKAQPRFLVADVETRWNSTVEMMQSYIDLKPALIRTLRELDDFKEAITDQEWVIITWAIQLSEPICRATTILGGDTYPTLSLVYPVVRMIRQRIKVLVPPTEALISFQVNHHTFVLCGLMLL